MAEFCLDCLNKINGTNYDKSCFVLLKDLELCEECGQWKQVVVTRRQFYCTNKLVLLVYELLKLIILFLWRVIASIFMFLKNKIKKN